VQPSFIQLDNSVLFHFNGNASYLTTSTLNTKYNWAVLIKLHDSATYDDRRKSYEWLKHQAPEFPEKKPNLPQVTDKLYHIEITLVLLPINNSQATVDEK
jgi:hypothetical protein